MKNLLLASFFLASVCLIGCNNSATVASAPPDVKPVGAPMTVEAYSAKLDEITKASNAAMAPDMQKVQEAKTMTDKDKAAEALTAAFKDLSKLEDEAIGKLQAINPPAELAKAHEVLIQGSKDVGANFREGVAAMESKDSAKMEELMKKLQATAMDLSTKLSAELDKAGYKLDGTGAIVKK